MGIFNTNKKTLDYVFKYAKTNNYLKVENIEKINFDDKLDIFGSEEMLASILLRFIKNDISFIDRLSFVGHMFQTICSSNNDLKQINIFNQLFDLYISSLIFNSSFANSISGNNNFNKVVSSFSSKEIVLNFFKHLASKKINVSNSTLLIDYIIEARQYFVDDNALLSSAISLINSIDTSILEYDDNESIKTYIEEKLIDNRKTNGIYDVDEYLLAKLDAKVADMKLLYDKLYILLKNTNSQIEILDKKHKMTEEDITNLKNNVLATLQIETEKIINNFNNTYLELLNRQESSLITEKDSIIEELKIYMDTKKLELQQLSNTITKKLELGLIKISNTSDNSIERIKAFVDNSDTLKALVQEATTNNSILDQLNIIASNTPVMSDGTAANVVNIPQIAIPNIIIPKEEEIDNTVNYYFDKTISFNERFNKLMELKQKDIEENGAIYHEKFDDVLAMVIQNNTPYMYGPSGCGKTYMIKHQMSKLLELPITINGSVPYEQAILGYTNSGNGAYVPSNFYRCFKYGNPICFDELDSGMANATVILNQFIGIDEIDSYVFPNGETVKKHPNFRIISAGNTNGSAKTNTYNGRQKIDESVMQRLTPIKIGYDNRIEERILQDYPNWYNFAINFRKAIESIPGDIDDDTNITSTFTTRDAEAIKKYLDDKCFNNEQLIEYFIIKNKDSHYLQQILSQMHDNNNLSEDGKKLFKKFSEQVKNRGK